MTRSMILTVLVFSSLFILFGCQMPMEEDLTIYPKVSSYEDAKYWMYFNIEYELDSVQYGTREYWALPEETMVSKRGDCEDHAALFIAICKANFGVEGVIYVQKNAEGIHHAYVIVDGYRFAYIEGDADTGDTITYSEYRENAGDHYANRAALEEDVIEECSDWVSANIKYQKELVEDWKLAEETISDGYGDCEDIAICWLSLVYERTGKDGWIVIQDDGSSSAHASASVDMGDSVRTFYALTNAKTIMFIRYTDFLTWKKTGELTYYKVKG